MDYTPKTVKHEQLCAEFRDHFASSPFHLEDRIGLGHCTSSIKAVRVWPMFEQLYILEKAATQRISGEAKQRLKDLETNIQSFSSVESPLQQALTSTEDDRGAYTVKIVGPNDQEYLLEGLEHIPTCYDKRKRNGITGRLLADIELGGTVIYFLEKDGVPVTYNKLFVCPDNKGGTFLFYDAIENGVHTTDTVEHWVVQGKFEELVYSVAFAGYMTTRLGLDMVALADRELDEFGAMMGCNYSNTLLSQDRKLGWPTHPKNRGEVVHQNRLFGRGVRFSQLKTHKARDPQQILDNFRRTYAELERKKFNPKSHHFIGKIYYLLCANRIMQSIQGGNKADRVLMANAIGQLQPHIDDNQDFIVDSESSEIVSPWEVL